MINKVILIGTIVKDPEIRNTQNSKVVTFCLATKETYKNKGQKKTVTEWHSIVIWGKLVNIVEKYVRKGSHLYIEGKLSTRFWEDTKGTKRYTTEVIAYDLIMLPSAKGSIENSQTYRSKDDVPFYT